MIKKNNKGFTLLELLISIFILTTVIFLGYRVINKSIMDIKNQGNINKGQLTVNDMNEYLTKDLEQARSIALYLDGQEIANTKDANDNIQQQDVLKEKVTDLENKLSEENDFYYSYKIKFEEDENIEVDKSDENSKYNVIYQVDFIKKDENNYKYTIKRTDITDGVSITFVNDEKFTIIDNVNIELPFIIEGNSPYKVILGYNGKNNEFEKHEFAVTSRLYGTLVGDGNTNPGDDTTPPPVDNIKPPEEWVDDPIIPTDYNAIGFWTADSGKRKKDNLYTWISTHGAILGEAYADQETGKNDKFNIEGFARPENKGQTASYIGYNTMDKDNNWKGQVKDVYIGEKNIVKISIYVSPNTKLENFKIQKLQGNADIQIPETLNEGWHHCTITTNSQVSFKFKGELSIDKSQVDSGYAYVVYERKDGSNNDTSEDNTKPLKGDIIFEVSNIVQGTNSNQRTLTQIVKCNKDNKEVVVNEQIAKDVGDNNIKEMQCYMFIDKNEKYISLFMQPGISEFKIYQNQIDKDISKISKIRIFLDDNIYYIRSHGSMSFTKVNNYYEGTFDHFQENINMYFNFSNIENSDVKNGKVYIELIEE